MLGSHALAAAERRGPYLPPPRSPKFSGRPMTKSRQDARNSSRRTHRTRRCPLSPRMRYPRGNRDPDDRIPLEIAPVELDPNSTEFLQNLRDLLFVATTSRRWRPRFRSRTSESRLAGSMRLFSESFSDRPASYQLPKADQGTPSRKEIRPKRSAHRSTDSSRGPRCTPRCQRSSLAIGRGEARQPRPPCVQRRAAMPGQPARARPEPA